MTDRLAIYLGGILTVAILLDVLANGGGVLLFLARMLVDSIEFLAFWR